MKVLLVNSEKLLRGGEFQTISLGLGLERAGCDVVLAARQGSALAGRASESLRCEEFRFEHLPLATPLALARLIARWSPDILHAQTSDAHTHLWLGRMLLPDPPPLVVSRRVAFPVKKDVLSLLKYRTRVARYIPISAAAAASLANVGVPASRMTTIPSGVDVNAFRNAKGSPDILERWGVTREDFIIGTVAAFEIEKGHTVLLSAAAKILREQPRARFVLIGEGRLENELEAESIRRGLAGRVIFASLDAPLEKVLPLFDIFALPSLQEGLSTALIAAMATGVPVVASLTGGIPDAVTPDCGILVPPADADAFAGAVITLANNEKLRERMGSAGVRRAANFDIDMVVGRMIEVYEDVLRELKSRGKSKNFPGTA